MRRVAAWHFGRLQIYKAVRTTLVFIAALVLRAGAFAQPGGDQGEFPNGESI